MARAQSCTLGAPMAPPVHMDLNGTKAMLLSFVPGEDSPEAFYRRFGFEPTGEVDEGEHVMRLAF